MSSKEKERDRKVGGKKSGSKRRAPKSMGMVYQDQGFIEAQAEARGLLEQTDAGAAEVKKYLERCSSSVSKLKSDVESNSDALGSALNSSKQRDEEIMAHSGNLVTLFRDMVTALKKERKQNEDLVEQVRQMNDEIEAIQKLVVEVMNPKIKAMASPPLSHFSYHENDCVVPHDIQECDSESDSSGGAGDGDGDDDGEASEDCESQASKKEMVVQYQSRGGEDTF